MSDVWASEEEIEEVEALADGFVLGNSRACLAFFRAGGVSVNLMVVLDQDFLLWIGDMLKRIYTRALSDAQAEHVMLPLNPFRVIQHHLNFVRAVWLSSMVPEPDLMSMFFGAHFQMGASIIPRNLLQEDEPGIANVVDEEWILADRSPGLKAITAHFISEPVESQSVPASLPVHGIDLPTLASSSLFAGTSSCNANVPLDTTAVRRSTRSNKYDGFKVSHATDVKQSRSRVKARIVPTVNAVSTATAPAVTCPPPTSIQDIQHVGARCGSAAEDISEDKLLATQQIAPDEAV